MLVPLTVMSSCFYRKNASRSWHARNLTASRTHTMMRFLPHRPILSWRPGAAGEGSAPRSTLKRMPSATYARSVWEDGCIHKHPHKCLLIKTQHTQIHAFNAFHIQELKQQTNYNIWNNMYISERELIHSKYGFISIKTSSSHRGWLLFICSARNCRSVDTHSRAGM